MPAGWLTPGRGRGPAAPGRCARALALGAALGLAALTAAPPPAAADGGVRGEFSWRDGRHGAPSFGLRRGFDRGFDRRFDHRPRLLLRPPLDDDATLKRRQRVIVPTLRLRFGRPWWHDAPPSVFGRVLTPGEVVDRLLRQGFERIKVVQVEPGLVRVQAVDPLGQRVGLLVDSLTGRIVRMQVLG